MTQTAYLGWMEHKILTESQLMDHSKWPCRKRKWNSGAKDGGSRYGDNRFQYVGDKNYHQAEEFFGIQEMMSNDETIKSKKLFLLYIKMDDPNGINKDAAFIAWTPLAKVYKIVLILSVIDSNFLLIQLY